MLLWIWRQNVELTGCKQSIGLQTLSAAVPVSGLAVFRSSVLQIAWFFCLWIQCVAHPRFLVAWCCWTTSPSIPHAGWGYWELQFSSTSSHAALQFLQREMPQRDRLGKAFQCHLSPNGITLLVCFWVSLNPHFYPLIPSVQHELHYVDQKFRTKAEPISSFANFQECFTAVLLKLWQL